MRTLSRRTFAKGACLGLLGWLGIFRPGRSQAGDDGEVQLAVGGKTVATIVVPDDAVDSVHYAAAELCHHLEKATGVAARTIAEGAFHAAGAIGTHVFLGETLFAKRAGINASTLAPETCLVQTVGRHLCIAGRDHPGAALDENVSAGTLFGVYEFLDRYAGVRWLWPGELGTFVPRIRSLSIAPTAYLVTPRFLQRHVRPFAGSISALHPEMGFTADAARDYTNAQSQFLRRNRMGRSTQAKYGHAFVDWWKRYGAERPEWFQLVNGKRGPTRSGARFSMCISNPGLREEIVSQWRQHREVMAGSGAMFVNAVENDAPGLCECDVCRSLDDPEPSDYRRFLPAKSKIANKPLVSGRYARSWQAIQQIAAKDDPDAVVVGYAYMNYFAAPAADVKLNQHVMIGFCPSSWFYPRSDEEQGWIKQQWLGWAATTARLFIRPNYFLDGYCMPHIFATQFADEFTSAARNGMVGTDFDSLTGQWATQGPNLYLLMRLQTHPETSKDALLSEYYSAFGPAADAVKSYFDYWERHTSDARARLHDTFQTLGISRWRSWAKGAHEICPQASFTPAFDLLDRAAAAAAGNEEASLRVQFLRLGLEHARLCSQVAAKLTLADPLSRLERGRKELRDLIEFRRSHERTWLSNLNHCAWVESQSWLLPGADVSPLDADPE